MKMNRRTFIATTLTGTIGVALNRSLAMAGKKNLSKTDPFQLVSLGQTGIRVSLIGFGTGMRGGKRQSNQTRLGKNKFHTLLKYAYEKGIRFFDCADLYGTHPYLADALKSIPRENYVICSKIWVRPGGIPEKDRLDADIIIDRFRKELNTDYIDLVLIHCMTNPQWPDQQKRQMDIMADLKARGIIRAHGVSIHSTGALKACIDNPWVDSVHTRINAYGDSMDDKDPAVVVPVIKNIHRSGKGVVGMKLIGEGRYRDDPDKRDLSIKYALDSESVDTMIVGFENPQEIDDFATRVKNALLSKVAQSEKNQG